MFLPLIYTRRGLWPAARAPGCYIHSTPLQPQIWTTFLTGRHTAELGGAEWFLRRLAGCAAPAAVKKLPPSACKSSVRASELTPRADLADLPRRAPPLPLLQPLRVFLMGVGTAASSAVLHIIKLAGLEYKRALTLITDQSANQPCYGVANARAL